MKYFGSLIKNIDKTLLIIPAIFAVISIVMIGSTAYDGSFNFTRGMKIQLIAFVLGYIGLFITLLFDYQKFERWCEIGRDVLPAETLRDDTSCKHPGS